MNTTQMDQQAISLAQAIRKTESNGNFDAKGRSGELGAYQWMPNTWKAHAQEVLGNSNAPMTPENQNAVAYTIIKGWKDSGLNPAQIAAKWNSGSEKGWENKIGTNSMGVSYNVPKYVKSVTDTYQQIKGGDMTSPQIPNPSTTDISGTSQPEDKSFLRKVGDFFTGGTQKFGKTIGEAVVAPQNAELFSQAREQYDNITDQLNKAIQDKVAKDGDPTRLQMALKQHLQTSPKLEDFTGDVINKSTEQVLGEGISTGLEALSGGLLEGGIKTVASKELGLLGKLNQAGKIGSAYGAIGSGANAMEDNQNIGNVALDTAGGALFGYGLGFGTGGLGMIAGKGLSTLEKSGIVNKLLPQTEARVRKIEEFVNKAKQDTAESYKNSLPLTPTEQLKENNFLKRRGDNVYTTLAEYNINPGSKEAISQLQAISDQFENATTHAKDNEHALFNIDEMRNNAFHDINENLTSETARVSAKNKIDTEIDALLKANKSSVFKGANGESLVDSTLMERLRRTGNSWTPFNASDPEKIGKSAGYALSNAVRDQVSKQGTFPSYREANSEWGKIIHAQQILTKIADSGKQFKTIGGLGGSIARKVLSGVLGFHSGGLAGAILTELGSEYSAKILSNPGLRTYFNRVLVERFGSGKATPEAIAKLEGEIRNYLDHQARIPRLGSPTPMGTSGNPIIPPAPTTYEEQSPMINRNL